MRRAFLILAGIALAGCTNDPQCASDEMLCDGLCTGVSSDRFELR